MDEERDPDPERPRIPPRRPAPEPVMAREHESATTVLVLGIVGLVVCGLVSPFAWYMGNNALREIDRSGGRLIGRSSVNAGRVCGIIGTVFLVVGCCLGGLIVLGGGG